MKLVQLLLFTLPFSLLLLMLWWGEEDSNLRRLSQQIYSLPRLTASVSPRFTFQNVYELSQQRDSNPRPADYKSAALAN